MGFVRLGVWNEGEIVDGDSLRKGSGAERLSRIELAGRVNSGENVPAEIDRF